MTQHPDYGAIPNQPGTTYRAAVNQGFQSVVTRHLGVSEPARLYPCMEWYNLNNYHIYERNYANTAWFITGRFDAVGGREVYSKGAPLANGLYVGEMRSFAGHPPPGWLYCDGAAVSRTVYAALNAVIAAVGYPYGAGNGSTTFNLPNRQGRAGVGTGAGVTVEGPTENVPANLGETHWLGKLTGLDARFIRPHHHAPHSHGGGGGITDAQGLHAHPDWVVTSTGDPAAFGYVPPGDGSGGFGVRNARAAGAHQHNVVGGGSGVQGSGAYFHTSSPRIALHYAIWTGVA